jgi:hypothetical protein
MTVRMNAFFRDLLKNIHDDGIMMHEAAWQGNGITTKMWIITMCNAFMDMETTALSGIAIHTHVPSFQCDDGVARDAVCGTQKATQSAVLFLIDTPNVHILTSTMYSQRIFGAAEGSCRKTLLWLLFVHFISSDMWLVEVSKSLLTCTMQTTHTYGLDDTLFHARNMLILAKSCPHNPMLQVRVKTHTQQSIKIMRT